MNHSKSAKADSTCFSTFGGIQPRNLFRGKPQNPLEPDLLLCISGKNMKESADYDSPWKEVIEHYFKEFIEFFFPKAFEDVDWEKGYEFLDKELRQITKDAKAGRKYVDKLVRVWLKTGENVWAVIHADVQTQREKDFSERIYIQLSVV
jgi:hypothetical protein